MSNSNSRIKEPLTFHHIINRIAHRVFFLRDEERNDFLAMLRRVAEFTGIKLVGWCIMTNHFHLLAFLPERIELDEVEIIRRVGILKGASAAKALASQFAELRAKDAAQPTQTETTIGEGEAKIQTVLERLRKRMYDVGSFMKTLKQWFTEDYNHRSSHVGTLWESTYVDRAVPTRKEDLAKVLAYIFLNPIRAGICPGFDEYEWSSLHAAGNGDQTAIDGLRLVYGDEMDVPSMIEAVHTMMDSVLEQEKRDWANEVARRRRAGYDVPKNPLTDEAYVAQAAAHWDEVLKAGTEIYEQEYHYRRSREKSEALKVSIIDAIKAHPMLKPSALSRLLGKPKSTVCKCIRELVASGALHRDEQTSQWRIVQNQV
jgi:REP element-mobilizing transposase RayT